MPIAYLLPLSLTISKMPPPDDHSRHSRVRVHVIGILLIVAVVVALVITPPLLNVERYRQRIAQTIGDSLGRPVHIDQVKLHLLPLPSLELRNVVVSEDPAFGSEPTIRANLVRAILRPASLWRRQIEFSTIRFAADENGAGPSVNLVRNAAGRWNLDSVLMQAASHATAPTAQRRAGPVPRFPYIEADAARVNLKLDSEKMPFSLTEAEFALWLPDPGEWHVRLRGKPTRTDANVSETGTVQVEGTLQRAPSIAQVPVDLQATWTDAQLGEATALLTGQDMGWRGTGTLTAALRGPLGDAHLSATFELHSLRRAEFVPAHMLDLTVTCAAHATITEATLEQATCSLPAPLPNAGDDAGKVAWNASRLDLTSRRTADTQLSLHASDAWLLDWVRLLTPGVPPDENPEGSVEGSLQWVDAAGTQPGFWNGQIQGEVHGKLPWANQDAPGGDFPFLLQASPDGLDLEPVDLSGGGTEQLSLRAILDETGYRVRLLGQASAAQVQQLAHLMPPFDTGLQAVLPEAQESASDLAERVDFTCSRGWFDPAQTCAQSAPGPAPHTQLHSKGTMRHRFAALR